METSDSKIKRILLLISETWIQWHGPHITSSSYSYFSWQRESGFILSLGENILELPCYESNLCLYTCSYTCKSPNQ